MTELKFTENTSISVGLILTIILPLLAIAVAGGVIKAEVANNTKGIQELRTEVITIRDFLINDDKNLSLK